MTVNLDIYVVSRQRDAGTIEQFLSKHVDRSASEERGNEELMMLPLNLTSQSYPERWDWEPCPTLHDAVRRGMAKPYRAFSIYLEPIDPALQKIILAFTTD